MKKLGVIGGLGPMATAYFMQLLIKMTDAKTDQEHIETLIYSKPSIPDRTKYILNLSKESPVKDMVEVGRILKNAGAEIVAMPCITAHYFHGEVEREIGLPIINIIEETVSYLADRGISCAGIMATDGTISSRLFQDALEKKEIQSVIPNQEGQQKIMDIIFKNVKAGEPVDMEGFLLVSDELRKQGAQVILLACTELSVVKRDYGLAAGYLDVMEVLARKSVQCCNVLREEYLELIAE